MNLPDYQFNELTGISVKRENVRIKMVSLVMMTQKPMDKNSQSLVSFARITFLLKAEIVIIVLNSSQKVAYKVK